MRSGEPYSAAALPVLSDIHGNLAGFEAALAALDDLEIRRPPLLLGDYLWCHHPDADPDDILRVLDLIMARPLTAAICGNTDCYFVNGRLDRWRPEGDVATAIRDAMRAVRGRLSAAQIAFLKALPQSFTFSLAGRSCLACHASPLSNADGLPLDIPAAKAAERLAGSRFDCLFTGHLHRAFTRHMDGGALQVGLGAVGRHPHEFDGIVDFAVVDATPTGLTVVHHRVAQPVRPARGHPVAARSETLMQ